MITHDKVSIVVYYDLMDEGKDEQDGLTYDHWYKWPRFGWYIMP
jgi:hypothetical protein